MNLNNRIGHATPAEVVEAPPDPLAGFSEADKKAILHGASYWPDSKDQTTVCGLCARFAELYKSGKIIDGIHFNV